MAKIVRDALAGSSLGNLVAEHRDNIVLLRLIAALLVVWGHSYVLAGIGLQEVEPIHRLLGRPYAHFVGLVVFFVLSGFLITLSWERRPELDRFVRARGLRIYPALIACVAITTFVIGPIISTAADYWHSPLVYHYASGSASLLDVQMFLPGVFENAPATSVVNGSLWTLPVEAALYLAVAVVGTAGLLRHRYMVVVGVVITIGLSVLWPILSGENVWLGLSMAGFFGIGACAYLMRDYLPISGTLLIAMTVAWYLACGSVLETPAFWATVAYGALWFAYVPQLPDVLRGNDLSYGIYLWAFPIQQLIVAAGVRSPIALFGLTVPIAGLIALLSWRWIERPALALKG